MSASILLPCLPDADGEHRWSYPLPAGLYQVSVIADAAGFPMEELYYEMHEFGNQGARTGPWDFKPNVGSPLVPAYWVYLNGEKLGLWVFARLSLEDLEARRFRGRFAFRVRTGGVQTLRLVPYRSAVRLTRWQMALLETDPVDELRPMLHDAERTAAMTLRSLSTGRFREVRRQQLTPEWRTLLEPALERVLDLGQGSVFDAEGRTLRSDPPGPGDMTACVLGWQLFGNEAARRRGLDLLDELIALPGWGRPNEEIYGWDGDLVAIDPFRAAIYGYYGLDLPEELKKRTREKLRYQGHRFVVMALLTRDYWGGSVLQDHGWRAILGFAECATSLLGEFPEAGEWLEWVVPRFRQTLNAMPRDGHLPASSYGMPLLYAAPLARLRQTWLEATGEDLYDALPVRPLLDALPVAIEHHPERLVGSSLFLRQMAGREPGSNAANWLERSLHLDDDILNTSYFSHRPQAQDLFESFLYYPGSLPCGTPEVPSPAFHYFEDAGSLLLRDPQSGLRFEVQCGPWLGQHAYAQSDNPCDRMCIQVGPGSFTLGVGESEAVVHPDSRYALNTATRNSLLIDGRGQIGDIGYPMSIPAWIWRGERITAIRHDAATGHFHARLDLAPLYPPESGVITYTRDFLFTPGGPLLCRDRLLLERPRTLEWHFHALETPGITPGFDPLACRFGAGLLLTATTSGLPLALAIRPTPMVYGYSSAGHRHVHAAYTGTRPVDFVEADFTFRPL